MQCGPYYYLRPLSRWPCEHTATPQRALVVPVSSSAPWALWQGLGDGTLLLDSFIRFLGYRGATSYPSGHPFEWKGSRVHQLSVRQQQQHGCFLPCFLALHLQIWTFGNIMWLSFFKQSIVNLRWGRVWVSFFFFPKGEFKKNSEIQFISENFKSCMYQERQ